MKRAELIFTAALVPIDYLMLVLAGLAAYWLRTSTLLADWRPVLFGVNLPLEKYLGLVALIGFFMLIIFALTGLYEKIEWKTAQELADATRATGYRTAA